jgi:hypothetical protein
MERADDVMPDLSALYATGSCNRLDQCLRTWDHPLISVGLFPPGCHTGKINGIGARRKGTYSMEVPVIIEPVTGNGYRATGAGGLSVGLTAEGATAAEAVDRLADQVRMRVNAGAKLAELSVGARAAPWMQDAGFLHDDPLYEPWRDAMEEYRRQLDEDPEAL